MAPVDFSAGRSGYGVFCRVHIDDQIDVPEWESVICGCLCSFVYFSRSKVKDVGATGVEQKEYHEEVAMQMMLHVADRRHSYCEICVDLGLSKLEPRNGTDEQYLLDI